jgi:transposase
MIEVLLMHSDIQAENKVFIAFIALIISSYINNMMKEKGMFKSMTFRKIIINLNKSKSSKIDANEILRPLTKEQKFIFKTFAIEHPSH